MSEEELRPEDVDILEEWTITVRPTLEEETKQTIIIYRYKDYPPDIVTITKEKPTDEEIWEAIKERLKARLGMKPRKLKVPGSSTHVTSTTA